MPDPLDLRAFIRDIPDFPKPGILFRDVTPLLADTRALGRAVHGLADPFRGEGVRRVLGIESRGFILGTPVALELDAGFVPVRKSGKLPHDTRAVTYDLEYGTDTLEMHTDAVRPGERVLIVDDLIATGGTAAAALRLATDAGAEVVACAFLVELTALAGRKALGLPDDRVLALLQY